MATSNFVVRFGRNTTKRAKTYPEATRILTGLRWEVDQGTYDSRDYKASAPLGFETLAIKWLGKKQNKVSRKHFCNLSRCIKVAIEVWGQTNVKSIGYAEIEDFLDAQTHLSDKSRANMRSCLNSFWEWLGDGKRKILTKDQMPDIPHVQFELGFRNIVSKELQVAIIEEVRRISFDRNPKIWLGIRWLATYVSIRPGALNERLEAEIDSQAGRIVIPHPKQKKPQILRLLPDDVEILKTIPRGLPTMPFFRHTAGIKGVRADRPFGDKYLYKWWKKACANLGVEGVDLYGGTKHSSITAAREHFSPEKIRRAAQIKTNSAFDRYLQAEEEDASDIWVVTAPNAPKKESEKNNVIYADFRKEK